METPILDFVQAYAASDTGRLHMPGHKGRGPLGFEQLDITEIKGADALYEADGIIARSETNASELFGTGMTLYSTEGSSQCIRAMLYLAQLLREGRSNTILAARNVHRAFVYGAALLDFEIQWLHSASTERELCSCFITSRQLEDALIAMEQPPAAVYVTSPDYLGNRLDICSLADVCHRHGTLLLVDNAHGAYLHFLPCPEHPMDLGADLCCDSAHKTLSALTGGAYLHLSKRLPDRYAAHAKAAMAMFGSTSPSYLILASLDACNAMLSDGYRDRLVQTIRRLDELKAHLTDAGWCVMPTDPLKLTLHCTRNGLTGTELSEILRQRQLECEFADGDHIVFMLTDQNTEQDLLRLEAALLSIPVGQPLPDPVLPELCPIRIMSVREAIFRPQEDVPVEQARGRICGAPTVGCPPAVPILVSGEEVSAEALIWMRHYGVDSIRVVSEENEK